MISPLPPWSCNHISRLPVPVHLSAISWGNLWQGRMSRNNRKSAVRHSMSPRPRKLCRFPFRKSKMVRGLSLSWESTMGNDWLNYWIKKGMTRSRARSNTRHIPMTRCTSASSRFRLTSDPWQSKTRSSWSKTTAKPTTPQTTSTSTSHRQNTTKLTLWSLLTRTTSAAFSPYKSTGYFSIITKP